ALEMERRVRGKGGKPPKWLGGSFEYDVPKLGLKVQGGIPLRGKLNAWLVPNPITGAWQLRLQPPTLLDAIWLQLGAALTSNAELKQCEQCGTWFEAGVGTGRRADAKFCSDRCQVKHKSLHRNQKKEEQQNA